MSGCGAASTDGDNTVAAAGSETVESSWEVAGGTDPELALLLEIIARTQPQGLSVATIGSIPEDAPTLDAVVGTKWVTLEYSPINGEEAYIEAFWKGGMIATAFRRAAEERGLSLIRGYTVRSRSSDGQVAREQKPSITADLFSYAPVQDTETLRTRLSQVQTPSLKLLSLDFVEPGGTAPIMTLETNDARASFRENSHHVGYYLGEIGLTEGYLVRVVDSSGALVWMQAGASRAGHGWTWAHPGLRGEYG
ncbi:MAG: hypothetical protein ACRDON_10345 [Gaiellaceae bacterium]